MTTTEPPSAPRPRLTVRTRFLAAVLALSALGLTVAGLTSWALQRDHLDALVDGALARNVDEFRRLAETGVDPATGSDFTSVSQLLRTALQRAVPSTNEGTVALVDGEVAWEAPTTVRLRIEDDPALLEAVARHTGEEDVVIRSLTTDLREYRYVTVPVEVRGDEGQGLLVFAFDRGTEHASLARTYRTYAVVSLGALVVTGVVGWLVAGRLLAPVRLLRRTAQRITDTDLSARIPVEGRDDLSELTRTVNAMLDRLEAAFASQRRLLDDAGHELRTPLTIIRGHLELVDAADPDDVTTTRALVLDEVDRMHRLVDDLVVLAKADRPDFVRPAPTDVAQLTDEVADKARSLGPQRWVVTSRADVTVALDAQRVTQAMLQLAANAAKFAPDDSTVRIGSEVVDDRLRLVVADEGPGVPPDEAERVFERFARAHAGRGVEGSGLGLPIVAAIAAAHGGTVTVVQDAGPGATFVVELPARASDAEEPAPTVASGQEES